MSSNNNNNNKLTNMGLCGGGLFSHLLLLFRSCSSSVRVVCCVCWGGSFVRCFLGWCLVSVLALLGLSPFFFALLCVVAPGLFAPPASRPSRAVARGAAWSPVFSCVVFALLSFVGVPLSLLFLWLLAGSFAVVWFAVVVFVLFGLLVLWVWAFWVVWCVSLLVGFLARWRVVRWLVWLCLSPLFVPLFLLASCLLSVRVFFALLFVLFPPALLVRWSVVFLLRPFVRA